MRQPEGTAIPNGLRKSDLTTHTQRPNGRTATNIIVFLPAFDKRAKGVNFVVFAFCHLLDRRGV